MGLFRPVILLPSGWRSWSAALRDLILGHELAHVRRHDYLAGLVAELAACLCWFHPLVRWLAGRLRLEQEYAADAWVASARSDATDYVRCLARLALEQSHGRGPLAPAFWRRRPEILRRIDMLRRNPKGHAPRLGKRAAWAVAVLTAAACVVVAGVGPLRSAPEGAAAPAAEVKTPTDPHGDALPDGALARLGTTRMRHGAEVTFVAFGPGGKTLLTAGQDNTIRLWDLADGKEIRRFARPAAVAPKPAPPKPAAKGDKQAEEAAVELEAVVQFMAGGRNDRSSFSVALTPDGKTLAASGPNVIQLWEVETGKELRKIEAPASGLSGLLFSPDGKTLAARAADGALVLWSAETGKEFRQIKPAPRPKQDGFVIILGGGEADPPGMAFTPDGKALAASATDYNKDQAVHSVKIWDLESGKEIQRIKAPGDADASAVAVAPGGKILAYGLGGVVHLCEADSGKELRQFKSGDGGVLALAFAPDGKSLAVRGRNQRVRLWETETAKEIRQLGDAETNQGGGGGLAFLGGGFSGPEARALAISPDGKQLAAASGSTVRLWETATGKEVPLLEGHRRAPSFIALSGDGKSVISWGPDRVIRRWESATGKALGTFAAPAGTTAAAFSADGRTVALANADNTIRLNESATGKELHQLKGPQGAVSLAFAPDGKTLAARGRADNGIRLYDVAKGVELRQITPKQVNTGGRGRTIVIGGPARRPRGTGPGVAFSPDGTLLVATGPGNDALSNRLVFFDVATGKELRKIQSPRPIASFAFSPDGRTLAAENADRTITLWEVASGKEQAQIGKPAPEPPQAGGGMMLNLVIDGDGDGLFGGFTERAGPVGLTFSPDGRALAARGPDRSVHVWDVAGGKEIRRLKGHEGRVETVAFAADGKTLASGAADTTVLLWDANGPIKDLPKPEAAELPAAEVESLWADLAGEDAAKALRGVYRLVSAPRQAVPLLGERLKPAVRVDADKINGWISALENEKFAVRQEAAGNLLKVGEQAVPPLQKVLATSPPLETRKRVEELLDRLTSGTLTTEQLRLVRAVEALERVGGPEARRVLRTLAAGAPGTLTTREAQAALDRMGAARP